MKMAEEIAKNINVKKRKLLYIENIRKKKKKQKEVSEIYGVSISRETLNRDMKKH